MLNRHSNSHFVFTSFSPKSVHWVFQPADSLVKPAFIERALEELVTVLCGWAKPFTVHSRVVGVSVHAG